MTVINLRPVGWNGMTPRQWHTLRQMIYDVRNVAIFRGNQPLFQRALTFLTDTAGRDV